jgi:hypothetical protein
MHCERRLRDRCPRNLSILAGPARGIDEAISMSASKRLADTQ